MVRSTCHQIHVINKASSHRGVYISMQHYLKQLDDQLFTFPRETPETMSLDHYKVIACNWVASNTPATRQLPAPQAPVFDHNDGLLARDPFDQALEAAQSDWHTVQVGPDGSVDEDVLVAHGVNSVEELWS